MASAALQFIPAQPQVSTVIPGAKNAEPALDNFSAADGQLSPEVVQSMYDLWAREIMSDPQHLFLLFVILFAIGACTPAQQDSIAESTTPNPINPTIKVNSSRSCKPTPDDGVSPSYKPDVPERTVVGQGHVVTGVLPSSVDCNPIANAKLEFWPEEEGLGYPDSSRAIFFTDKDGRYRFECNLPEHIHIRNI